MLKKQLAVSLGLLLLVLLGVTQMERKGFHPKEAIAAGEHSSHGSHGEATKHDAGAHHTSEHGSHGAVADHGGEHKATHAEHGGGHGESHGDAHGSGHAAKVEHGGGHEAATTAGHGAAHGESHGDAHGGGHGEGHGEVHGGGGHGDAHGGGHHAVETKLLTPDVSWQAWLPVILSLFSIFTALLIPVFSSNDRMRNIIGVGTSVAGFLLILLMYGPVVSGVTIHGQVYKGIFVSLPLFLGFDATFKVDPASLVVAGVTVFLWILSTIHWISYKEVEEKHVRYETFVLVSLAMNMGVLMAGDFLTLFFFFEGMVIFPYSLIAHKEDPGALKGANMYLRLGCATGLSLLFGILLLQHYTGTITIRTLGPEINAAMPGVAKYFIAVFMIIGFGGKAGIFFEHAWLPNAHPVAPTPASCLLSGAMIKAGAYGIFRVVNMIFVPHEWGATLEWVTARHIGYAVIWVGIITMFFGVLNALISANSKRMLAYHSVSQMGYIVMGMGCAAYLGADGAMGLAGSMYHIVNHALFKASLFLTVGAVYFRTHELDMYKLGGLWRNMPFVCVAMFIAACAIAGIPGFNGFASKTLLHHSILEAYEHSAHYAANGLPDFKLKIAEIIFMITAGGTFASNMKLWVLDFLGDRQEKHKDIKPAPTSMKVSLGLVSAAILFIGLNPNWMIETIIGPALAYFSFNPASHPYHILYNTHVVEGIRSTIPILYNPVNFDFISNSEVVHNLLGGGDAVILGGVTFILGMRFGWFHSMVPEYLSIVYYYSKIFHAFKRICKSVFEKVNDAYDRAWNSIIYSDSIRVVIERVAKEKEGKSGWIWHGFEVLDAGYGEVIDRLIFSEGTKKAIKGDKTDFSRSDELLWKEMSHLDNKFGNAFDKAIFGRGVSEAVDKDQKKLKYDVSKRDDLSRSDELLWKELAHLDKKFDEVFDRAIFGRGVSEAVDEDKKAKRAFGGEKGDLSHADDQLWKDLTHLDKKFDEAFDKAIFARGVSEAVDEDKKTLKYAAGERDDLSHADEPLWKDLTHLDEKFDEAFDKAIFGKGVTEFVEEDKAEAVEKVRKDFNHAESQLWKELTELDEKYGEVFDKAIFGKGVSEAVDEDLKEVETVWEELKKLDEKYTESYDKIIFTKGMYDLIKKKRKGMVSTTKTWWERISEFDSLFYDKSLDKFLFGNIDPSAKPEENWFDKFCRKVSSIHSGDVSRYISWILIALAVVVAVLVSRLYIPSFTGALLLITVILFFVLFAFFLTS